MARRSNFYVIFCLLYSLVKSYNLKTFARAPLHSCKDIYSSRDLDGKLRECLTKEYSSFFSYTEDTLYSKDILFKDPLNTIRGFGNYKNNINMLAGRTFLGSKVFANSSLVLHNAEFLQDGRYQTRWTLSSTILFLPWRPRMEFTGVSRYSIREDGLIEQQEDFWDSINLLNGDYRAVGKDKAIADFLNQLSYRMEAEMVAPELPYELLRRTGTYEVRRYPDTVHAETFYQQRPEGYDRIGSYVSGSNSAGVKLPYFTPTLMRIPPVLYTINNDSDTTGQLRGKIMSWPLSYHNVGAEKDSFSSINSTHPASRIPGVLLRTHPSTVVAVLRFSVPATEVVVMGYTSNLLLYVQRDGLVPSAAALAGECVIAQYDALFSLNKRRNEVWVKLDGHVW